MHPDSREAPVVTRAVVTRADISASTTRAVVIISIRAAVPSIMDIRAQATVLSAAAAVWASRATAMAAMKCATVAAFITAALAITARTTTALTFAGR